MSEELEKLVDVCLEKFPNVRREELAEEEFRDGVPVLMIPSDEIAQVGVFLQSEPGFEFDLLKNLTAVDFEDRMVVVYHLYSTARRQKLTLKVETERQAPKLESAVPAWPTANWQEREVFDLFGIHFENHPDLRRIMLPEDWSGHPLRKDYVHEPDHYD